MHLGPSDHMLYLLRKDTEENLNIRRSRVSNQNTAPLNVTEIKEQAPVRADVMIQTLIEQRNTALNGIAILQADLKDAEFALSKANAKIAELTTQLNDATASTTKNNVPVIIDQPVIEVKSDGEATDA